jgi:hypothetical protein
MVRKRPPGHPAEAAQPGGVTGERNEVGDSLDKRQTAKAANDAPLADHGEGEDTAE